MEPRGASRILFGLGLVVCTGSLRAQNAPVESNACTAAIPASAYTRVPVYLQAFADSSRRAVLPSADFFAQSVAFKVRELLGARGSQLPEADSVLSGSTLWGEVSITARRNGQLSWRAAEWSTGADTVLKSSLAFLQRAIKEASDGGEMVAMPDGFTGDSVTFTLAFITPLVEKGGKVRPLKARQAIPVFTISRMWETPVEMTRRPNIEYPVFARSIGSIGDVRLTYVVDSTGKIKQGSIKESWPEGIERPKGQLRNAYDAFLEAVMRDLPRARFKPATLGGCPVNQVVVQDFNFLLER